MTDKITWVGQDIEIKKLKLYYIYIQERSFYIQKWKKSLSKI